MAIKKSKFFFEENMIETIGDVSDENYKPLPDNKNLQIIGKRIPRYDGFKKVTGQAKYTHDLALPNMAFAKIFRSSLPNAIIKQIDVSKAKKMKGVLDILTYKDVEHIEWYDGNSHLLDKHLRHEGDEIAFIVAENEQFANAAIKKIKIEFEQLKFSSNATEALSDSAYQNYEWGNILEGKPDEYERGNVEEGFKDSDEIIEGTFSTPVVIHNPTEVHCSLAKWDDDKLTVWDSTQGVYSIREGIASALDIPEEKVRLIKEFMGGGFGSKLETGKYSVLAAISAKKLKRPVKVALDRKEMNLAVGNRPDSVQKKTIFPILSQ